jgi:hypothetical protein
VLLYLYVLTHEVQGVFEQLSGLGDKARPLKKPAIAPYPELFQSILAQFISVKLILMLSSTRNVRACTNKLCLH